MRYVALLRGINVGGHTVKMERLRAIFTALGCEGVRTYIQSGNVFFDAAADHATLAAHIERRLGEALGYEVPTFLRTVPEMTNIVERDPFGGLAVTANMRLCVVFADAWPAMLELPWRSPKGDVEVVHMTDREAFVVWHLIHGRPPTPDSYRLGSRNTTRFFHTVAKMVEAARPG
jgi:uncharacterized protein (DUF1697 family)